jgi:antitoxin component YwqK of YwqJK toxin-antitoxin module
MKMLNTLSAVFFLLLLNANAVLSQTIPQNPNKIDQNGLRQGKWTILYDKNWQPTKEERLVAYYRIIDYKDSKVQGKIKAYSIDSILLWEGSFNSTNLDCASGCEDCLCEGLIIFYYENGNKAQEISYQNGKKHGTARYYDQNSKLAQEVEYENDQEKIDTNKMLVEIKQAYQYYAERNMHKPCLSLKNMEML